MLQASRDSTFVPAASSDHGCKQKSSAKIFTSLGDGTSIYQRREIPGDAVRVPVSFVIITKERYRRQQVNCNEWSSEK